MKQSGTSALLEGAVQDLASDVVSALRGGGHMRAESTAMTDDAERSVARAAVRVVGADVLLPHVLLHTSPTPDELTLFRESVAAYPPRPDATGTVVWSHWAMTSALRRFDPVGAPFPMEPDATWLDGTSWQHLTHQLAVLAPLARPGEDCAVARATRNRPVDVARGFVRAVRRRDWRQAAGAGRWLTLLPGVPDTLGLDAGLDFVDLMGGQDPRVALHLQAARLTRQGALA
ncbi:hypothetical protein I2W78_38745 [Streptomyces spinoverrucosus]|uniref:hypothetical protein n=1 Tax=Streptomyces spinoverrucosus TaxID=284043 RepID=UPI0018C3849A|nr:hypothetical protein [Streptomyces spinoverrucosus]MBG0857632.1 hypothetical protein [Streptomyces spinoverrucosus]